MRWYEPWQPRCRGVLLFAVVSAGTHQCVRLEGRVSRRVEQGEGQACGKAPWEGRRRRCDRQADSVYSRGMVDW